MRDRSRSIFRTECNTQTLLQAGKNTLSFGGNTLLWTLNSTTDITLYGLQQLGAIPPLVHAIKNNTKTRRLYFNAARVLVTHLLPILLAQAAHQWFDRNVLKDDDYFNSVTGATIGIPLFLITATFHLRNVLAITLKSMILMLDHKQALYKTSQPQPGDNRPEACHGCSDMRYIKGEVRSYITYFLTLGVINLVNNLFSSWSITGPIVFLFNCQLYGELFLEYRLADMQVCDRHRSVYFQQHPEISISLGAMLALTTYAITNTCQNTLGIQQGTLDYALKSLLSLFFLGLTYHMRLPKPTAESDRWQSPLSVLRSTTAIAMDLTAEGVKKFTKRFLRNQRKQPMKIVEYWHKTVALMNQPDIKNIRMVLTPKMLHSIKDCIDDPVLKEYINKICQHGIDFVADLNHSKGTWQAKLVTSIPRSLGSRLTGKAYGYPKVIGELIIALLKSKEFIAQLNEGKKFLESLQDPDGSDTDSYHVVPDPNKPATGQPRRRFRAATRPQSHQRRRAAAHLPEPAPEPPPVRDASLDTLRVNGVPIDSIYFSAAEIKRRAEAEAKMKAEAEAGPAADRVFDEGAADNPFNASM